MGDEHPIYAAVFDRSFASAPGMVRLREELLPRAVGRVLEVGGGTGHNLPYFTEASSVTIVEPDGAMRRRLEPRLSSCPAPASVLGAGIDEADLEDGSFDTVVCTLVLCTVPDLDRALGRIRRLLAPGGRLLFLEHTAAPGGWGLAQRALDPVWHRLVPGCHLHRDPVSAMRRAGFLVSDYERFRLPLLPGLVDAGVKGVAVERTTEPPVVPGTYPRLHAVRRRRSAAARMDP